MAKILITDDSSFMRGMLKNLLVNHGHEVIGEACNGLEAVKLFAELKPDLVTMDITMPEMSGIDAVKAITQIDKNAIIVMVSSMGQKAMVLGAIQSGAKDFIVKPFEDERVLGVLERLLSK